MSVVGKIDRGQRRFPVIGFPLAVVYKFFDDQGNYLAAVLTYYAFIAIFPMMLMASSILGFILQGSPDLQDEVLDSALSNFPIIGTQLTAPEGLEGSTGAVVVGSIAALYGCIGLGVAIQNVINAAWAVPRNSRPNPILLRVRALFMLAAGGLAILSVTALSLLLSRTDFLGFKAVDVGYWLVILGTVVIVTGMLCVVFRMATTRDHALGHALPGAFTFAMLWQVLQYSGAEFVQHVLAATRGMNQTFALVLGLVAFLYIAALMVVISIEVNVVYARHLWPRALLTLFTDDVELTEADRRAYASYALMQRHKGFETVAVTFDGPDGDTHEVVMDPSWLRKTARRIRRHDEFSRPLPPTKPPPPVPPGQLRAVPHPDEGEPKRRTSS